MNLPNHPPLPTPGFQPDSAMVWDIVKHLADTEQHFNSLQHQYRLLCSTWLLAVFGGFGFVLTHDTGAVLPAQLLASVIALAGAGGVTLLWLLDLRVYHQLLDSCFVEALRLEREHPWLPQVRSRMLQTQGAHGVLSRVVWFYSCSILAVLAAGGSLTVLWLYHTGLLLTTLATAAGWTAISVWWACQIHRRSSSGSLAQSSQS